MMHSSSTSGTRRQDHLHGRITLTAAVHRVRLEYTDTWRNASITLRWQPVIGSATLEGRIL